MPPKVRDVSDAETLGRLLFTKLSYEHGQDRSVGVHVEGTYVAAGANPEEPRNKFNLVFNVNGNPEGQDSMPEEMKGEPLDLARQLLERDIDKIILKVSEFKMELGIADDPPKAVIGFMRLELVLDKVYDVKRTTTNDYNMSRVVNAQVLEGGGS